MLKHKLKACYLIFYLFCCFMGASIFSTPKALAKFYSEASVFHQSGTLRSSNINQYSTHAWSLDLGHTFNSIKWLSLSAHAMGLNQTDLSIDPDEYFNASSFGFKLILNPFLSVFYFSFAHHPISQVTLIQNGSESIRTGNSSSFDFLVLVPVSKAWSVGAKVTYINYLLEKSKSDGVTETDKLQRSFSVPFFVLAYRP